MQPLERIDSEIRRAEHLLVNGHTDVQGLALALNDWSEERRLLIQSFHDPAERIRLYDEFISSKLPIVEEMGGGLSAQSYPGFQKLYPFQQDIVQWALRRGRAAAFTDCGTGKTAMQLLWAWAVSKATSKPVLIFAPISVAEQTALEGIKFHVPVTVCESAQDILPGNPGVYITNYEKMHWFTDINHR
jgi:hypothetical protein